MIDIQKKGDGRLIEKSIYFGEGEEGIVQLRPQKGPEMVYGNQVQVVEFPGEYDIKNISVTCFEANKKLSYMFVVDGKRIALIQNTAALEIHSFDGVDVWLCLERKAKEELENMDLDGEVQILGQDDDKKDG